MFKSVRPLSGAGDAPLKDLMDISAEEANFTVPGGREMIHGLLRLEEQTSRLGGSFGSIYRATLTHQGGKRKDPCMVKLSKAMIDSKYVTISHEG